MPKRLLLGLMALLGFGTLQAQELRCDVQVVVPQLRTADPTIFKTLETAIYEFMNNRKWTDKRYEPAERIQCTLVITISEEVSDTRFKGQATIQSSRPVYNSDYQTVLFNYSDKNFDFEYAPFTPLEYTENIFISNLTSMLAYYAYVVIGFDFDSFEKMGGTPYFLKAQNIVNTAQNTSQEGWKSYESLRNRYWLVDNLLNNRYRKYREGFYDYHMAGLDKMYDSREEATETINNTVQVLEQINKNDPNNFLVQLFLNAKAEELMDIYGDIPRTQKVEAINILSKIDAANSERYLDLLR